MMQKAASSTKRTNFQARLAVFFYFLFAGSAVTIWAVHIPQVEHNLGISHAQLGIVLLFLGAGALTAMQVMGAIIDRLGSRFATILGGVLTGLALILPGLAQNVYALAAALFVLGMGMGTGDVAMNAHAVEVEAAYGRPIFSAFHAFWSGGGVLGAAVGGAAIALGSNMLTTMTVFGLVGLVISLVLGSKLLPSKHVLKQKAQALSKQDAKALRKTQNLANRKYFGVVLLLGVMAGCGALIEGVGVDWSALYVIGQLGATSGQGAIAVVAFAAAMAAFRLVADRVVEKTSRLFIIRYGSLLAAVGVALALAASNIWLAIAGWFVAGLGISAVVPQIFALSAVVGEESHSGRNMAKVVGLCYAGVLGGPAIIGLITNLVPLRFALLVGLVSGVVIWLSSTPLKKALAAKN